MSTNADSAKNYQFHFENRFGTRRSHLMINFKFYPAENRWVGTATGDYYETESEVHCAEPVEIIAYALCKHDDWTKKMAEKFIPEEA